MAETGGRFVFGGFELDVDNGALRREGAPIKLPPQPFRALHLLVSRAGRLVTRDELCAALWNDGSVVDFNGGLNFCIAQLRTALDDPASRSAFIVAVPKRGYRFVAPVARAVVAAEPVGAPEPVAPAPRASRRLVWELAVATAIATLAALALTRDVSGVAPRLAARHGVAALAKYERGVSALADAAPEELRSRVRHFEAAIAAEPGFAEAYAGIADAKLILGTYRAEPPPVAYAAAKAAAAKAIALDGSLAEAHAAYGAALMYFDWDWRSAGDHLSRAAERGPTSPRVHQWYSRYLSAIGRHDDAIVHARRAVALAPASASARTDLGGALFYAGQAREALAACDDAAALMREFVPARLCAIGAAGEAGAFDVTARYGLPPASDPRSFWIARADRLRTEAPGDDPVTRALPIAAALVHAGDVAEALAWLERAANRRSDTLIFAGVHPALAPIRSQPRFVRVRQRVGLP